MSANLRRLIILLLGVLLLVAPLLIRFVVTGNWRRYQPPTIGPADVAVTPIPTATAIAPTRDVTTPAAELSRGPVVVDLAHFNQLSRGQFQPLEAALADWGVGLRFWTSGVNLSTVETFESFPDQSKELAPLLQDASGLVVISPLFLWTPDEIALVEKFVADGGRLLLISDPDVPVYIIHDLNNLGEPFGVVFNEDYLYDLSKNDSNYTHFFLDEFLDRARALRGSTVAFYGARSIGGSVVSQVRTADTTRSSLRTGLTRFTTVALGGRETHGVAGNVLAMGDFDVLTEPYVGRYDNHGMLEFVADFLAGGQRVKTLPNFPAYLGQNVGLIFGGSAPVDADLLSRASLLQQRLDETGRELTLANSSSLSPTGTAALIKTAAITATPSVAMKGGGAMPQDLIYLGTFQAADEETALLANAGIHLVAEVETTEVTATPGARSIAEASGGVTPPVTATVTPTSATSTPEPEVTGTPVPSLLLETDFGLRLLAAETVLLLQQEQADGSQVTAVLGYDTLAVGAGLDRLLFHNLSDCVNHARLSFCPFTGSNAGGEGPTNVGTTAPGTPTPTTQAEGTPSPGASTAILLVDDNDQAAPDEASEAAIYLQSLTEMGYAPVSWSTTDSGAPGPADLSRYGWVIWSGGLYGTSGPTTDELNVLGNFVTGGGQLTISGRNNPLVDPSSKEASVIADVVKTDAVPELVVGFPDEPIVLPTGLPPVAPMVVQAGDSQVDVILRRGPKSGDAEAPLMVVSARTGGTGSAEGRVAVVGIPLNWLPDGYAAQLVRNMAAWILAR